MRSRSLGFALSKFLGRRKAVTLFQTGTVILANSLAFPTHAQLPLLRDLIPTPQLINQNLNNRIVSACVRLDGRCLFKIADQKSALPDRINGIEQRLNDVSSLYFKENSSPLKIRSAKEGKLPNIYINIGNREVRLMSVTAPDADLQGVELETRADQLVEQLETGLNRAKQERQLPFLIYQGKVAAAIFLAMLIVSVALYRWQRRSKHSKKSLDSSNLSPTQPISTQLTQQQQWNIKEVQHRLTQLAQASILGGGSLFILGLFPYTRMFQILIITSLQIPVKVCIIGIGTYVIVRLSYALIERFACVFTQNSLLTPEANQRLRLRISTISGVTKGIVTVTWTGVAILVTLMTLGVNIGPLLAGAGLVGVALSLASQNLIKDAINGFFIILEDQYAIGDVISVDTVGGFVETMNLRITQLRDAEGRLITIPNSEIKIVANLSSSWSRADLNIPVAYHADVDKALEVINQVTQDMTQDEFWRQLILDKPEVLGVDDFGTRGLIIRVWIKTEPLKQWLVARECRRRLKIALDKAGISIPMPQQEVWFNNLPANSPQDEQAIHHQK
ncbi:MAG: mechanosensitive ion channel family protein [Coleofasciculaceae cyanobacterium]